MTNWLKFLIGMHNFGLFIVQFLSSSFFAIELLDKGVEILIYGDFRWFFFVNCNDFLNFIS
ncbi:hypothetical protein FLM03_06890 [Vibrio cholerae]|nr:hypothetical protein [Vibrio cholerae]TQP13052.1 hypothetical protein FLM03_06890 [Vibrio cholerae]TQP21005.1 hypothetical protein FLL94_16775 [Vibrio cholerae]TQP92246.1 hypothetical protein FLL87_05830 [Vibrio cholerae]TXZ84839.1 hypothetical protein FXE50_23015 [Vibrio cholerae]